MTTPPRTPTGYRVKYTEIKPGGHHAHQDESVRGTRSDVVRYLSPRKILAGSVQVWEYFESDSSGTPIGDLGFGR